MIEKINFTSKVQLLTCIIYLFWKDDKNKVNKYHTEKIALEARKYDYYQFSWIVYQEYPDYEPARKGLFDARTEGYVIGAHSREKGKDGWGITEKGIEFAREILEKSENNADSKDYKENIDPKTLNLIKEIYKNKAFNKYNAMLVKDEKEFLKSKFSIYDFTEIISTPISNITYFNEKIHKLTLMFQIHDQVIFKFLKACAKKFPEFISDNYREVFMKARSRSKKKNKRLF